MIFWRFFVNVEHKYFPGDVFAFLFRREMEGFPGVSLALLSGKPMCDCTRLFWDKLLGTAVGDVWQQENGEGVRRRISGGRGDRIFTRSATMHVCVRPWLLCKAQALLPVTPAENGLSLPRTRDAFYFPLESYFYFLWRCAFRGVGGHPAARIALFGSVFSGTSLSSSRKATCYRLESAFFNTVSTSVFVVGLTSLGNFGRMA